MKKYSQKCPVMRYIELFSGIGAFTQALKNIDNIDSNCVFAADNNKQCAMVYDENYHMDSLFDLRTDDITIIPDHDFCFFSPPCQAFSKSGKQRGFEEARGTLIYEVFKILKTKKDKGCPPKYLLMENVRNLASHDNGNTMRVILSSLHDLGYRTPDGPIILSPHYFGVPQTRERVFLPGIYDPDNVDKPLLFDFDKFKSKDECSIETIIDHSFDNDEHLRITDAEEKALEAWDDFYNNIDLKVIGFPIWSRYFKELDIEDTMPEWKKDIIRKNKALYERNRNYIDKWEIKYDVANFSNTHRKFEWQAGTKIKTVWDGIIQSRPSGIRVKAPTTAPALVAIVQTTIIGRLKRRLSVMECAALQSFPSSFKLDCVSEKDAYRQLGNSINVITLQKITEKLLNYKDNN